MKGLIPFQSLPIARKGEEERKKEKQAQRKESRLIAIEVENEWRRQRLDIGKGLVYIHSANSMDDKGLGLADNGEDVVDDNVLVSVKLR